VGVRVLGLRGAIDAWVTSAPKWPPIYRTLVEHLAAGSSTPARDVTVIIFGFRVPSASAEEVMREKFRLGADAGAGRV
jgi:hypothetical protein